MENSAILINITMRIQITSGSPIMACRSYDGGIWVLDFMSLISYYLGLSRTKEIARSKRVPPCEHHHQINSTRSGLAIEVSVVIVLKALGQYV